MTTPMDANARILSFVASILCDPATGKWRVRLWADDERDETFVPLKETVEFSDKRAALSWLAGRIDSQHELMTRPVVPVRFDVPGVPPEHQGKIRFPPVTDTVLSDGPIIIKWWDTPRWYSDEKASTLQRDVWTVDRQGRKIHEVLCAHCGGPVHPRNRCPRGPGTENPQVSAARVAHARFEGERPCPQCGAYGCKLA